MLHCFCGDYNLRSRRVWEKNGFSLARVDPPAPAPKGQAQLHLCSPGRHIWPGGAVPPADQVRDLPLTTLTPSQLYISAGKLALVDSWCWRGPRWTRCPTSSWMESPLLTDRHTRAVWAHLHGGGDQSALLPPTRTPWIGPPTPGPGLVSAGGGVLSIEALAGRIVSHKGL